MIMLIFQTYRDKFIQNFRYRFATEAAEIAIKNLNPNITINKYDMRLADGFNNSFFKSYDIVVDGSDTLNTKSNSAELCQIIKSIAHWFSI